MKSQQDQFRDALALALKRRYGRIPSSQRLVDDLYRESEGQVSVTAEAARKWVLGKSVPGGMNFIYLDRMLGVTGVGLGTSEHMDAGEGRDG